MDKLQDIKSVHIETVKGYIDKEEYDCGGNCDNCPFCSIFDPKGKICGENEFWDSTESFQDRCKRFLKESESTKNLLQESESEWICYLFGNTSEINKGLSYIPIKGTVPNWYIRMMMKICLGCTWVNRSKFKHDG